MNNIQVYGQTYKFEDGCGVYITGVDVSQVVSEMNAREVLEALDYGEVIDYVAARNNGEYDDE